MHLCFYFITGSGSEEVGVTYFSLFVNSWSLWVVRLKGKIYVYMDGKNLDQDNECDYWNHS